MVVYPMTLSLTLWLPRALVRDQKMQYLRSKR